MKKHSKIYVFTFLLITTFIMSQFSICAEVEAKPQAQKVAYLTFDDGPSNNTVKILDILKQNNVKATFFVNGHTGCESIYKKIVSDGHAIGNHTYSHSYKSAYSSTNGFVNDINTLNNYIKKTTGVTPNVYRFPGGSNNTVSYKYGGKNMMNVLTDYMNSRGLKYFDWNIESGDATGRKISKQTLVNNVLNQSKRTNTAVVLMHDSAPKKTTVQALPEIIQGLKNQGFVFQVLTPESKAVRFK